MVRWAKLGSKLGCLKRGWTITKLYGKYRYFFFGGGGTNIYIIYIYIYMCTDTQPLQVHEAYMLCKP